MRFSEFDLDEPSARLLKSGVRVAITPKAFAVLCLLTSKAPNLVTKDDLLDAVWGHHHVSESVLKSVVSELRAALDDDARKPRFIETVSRRGYRFVALRSMAPAQAPMDRPMPADADPLDDSTPIVGRQAELSALHAGWRLAAAGQRQVVWIAGEPGVGKTTLIDHFVREVRREARVAHGQCVEQFGVGEPYMPVLEALATLCTVSPDFIRTLRVFAPTWLMQMPWLVDDDERDALRRELSGVGQERMVREFGELLERYAAPQPLLLITEDLHWSDPSTLLLMNHVSRRRSAARVMWLASFRVAEVIATDHPLQTLRHELRLHRHCTEIMLGSFTERELAIYLQQRLPDEAVDEPLVKKLHRHTDGLPLFVADVVEILAGETPIADGKRPMAAGRGPLPIPDSLSALVDRQMRSLPAGDRALLQAASVCGLEFSAEVVAGATNADPAAVDDALDRITHEHQWLQAVRRDRGNVPSPPLYGFRHALYRHFFYRGMSEAERRRCHLAIGEELTRLGGAASELAMHFELGGNPMRAAGFGAEAAGNALRHLAPMEAMELTTRALSLLGRVQSTRHDDEMKVLVPRAVAAAQLFGLTSPVARHAFVRMQWLARRGAQRSKPAAELGLGWMYNLQGKYGRALALARRVEQKARDAGDALMHAGACNLLGGTLALQGDLRGAAQWLEDGLRDFEPIADSVASVPFIVDLGVSMHSRLGHVRTNLGLIAQASAHAEAGNARARALDQPYARILALSLSGIIAIRLEQPERVMAIAQELESVVEGHALAEAQGSLRWLRGWAVARLGDPRAGCDLIEAGRRMQDDTGRTGGGSNAAIALAVEALLLTGDVGKAADELASGLVKTGRLGEGLHLLDLRVLQGRVALRTDHLDAARSHFETALSLARAQGAVWIEVQILTELLGSSPSCIRYRDDLLVAHSRLDGAAGTQLVSRGLSLLDASGYTPS